MSDWLDAEAHANRAHEMYNHGRWAEAEAELRKALALNPDQAEWHFNLGLTLEEVSRHEEALACFERAIELSPEQIEPMMAATDVCARMGRDREAAGWCDAMLKRDPRCASAYIVKIASQTNLGDHDGAEVTFYLAQQMLEKPTGECYAEIARSLFERGLFERAAWCLREALRLEPELPRARARLGMVYAAMGQPQRALQLMRRELRDDPGDIDTLLDYGELLMNLGRLPEAAEKFRRVLELEPANIDAHMRLGEIAMRAGRFERAHLEFELVLKLDPDYPHARLALAEAMLARQRMTEAQRCLREELDQVMAVYDEAGEQPEPKTEQAFPRHYGADSWARFGDLLLAANMPREASVMFELALLPKHSHARVAPALRAELLRRLALAHFRAGDRVNGVIASRRVLRIEPTSVPAIHNLALAALEDGRVEVAAAWVARGMKVDRHDDGLRRLRVRVWIARATRIIKRITRLGR